MTPTSQTSALRIEVQGLSTSFQTNRGRIQSVADVSFGIPMGSTLALVGESGSGKSVTSLSLMGLPAIEGQVSSPYNMPPGCAFSPRCLLADAQCDAAVPQLRPLQHNGGQVRCFKAQGVAA